MKKWIPLLAALALATPLYAQPVTPPGTQTVPTSEGTVRKVDTANAKLTLKHGPITNLDMPGMTMVFRVQPPELMGSLKVGDRVMFHAESINGAYVVTAIQPAP